MKNECDIVKDLLPSYVADLLSTNTNQFVKEHLDSCQKCRKLYEGMKKTNCDNEEEEQIEIKHLKKYNRHMFILKVILVILALIIIILPLIIFIKFYLNTNVASKAINNVNEYKNVSNYLLQITENRIDFERNKEQFYISKYFYKDGQYKTETHFYSPNVTVGNPDTFEYGVINSKEKTEIEENQKLCYNIKSNYIFRRESEFLDLLMIALQPFSEDIGPLINIWVRAGYKLRTDTYNGKKCYVLKTDSKTSYKEIWIDKEKNTLIRTIEEIYNKSYREKTYSIKTDVVTNEDVTLPDLSGYTIKNIENNIPNEDIELYEQLVI